MSVQSVKKRKIIGLTGNIASGKSQALSFFKSLGITTIDSDDIVRKLWKDHAFVDHLSQIFGINLHQKEIKQTFIKDVFSNDRLRKKLEDIIHPIVFKDIEEKLTQKKETIVIDMPLLFEVGFETSCDAVILVTIPNEIQKQRLQLRGLDDHAITMRIASQMNQDEKRKKTPYQVDGSLDIPLFENALLQLLKDIMQS